MTKDTKDRPDLSSERADLSGTALVRPAATVNYRPVLSSERTLQNNKPQLSKKNLKENEKLVAGPRWAPDTKTGRLIVGRNVTSTSTPSWGSLKPETIKYGLESWDSEPRMTELVRPSSNCKLQTSPFIRDGAPHQQNCNCLTVIKISHGRQMGA
jgi:hypothetical protein